MCVCGGGGVGGRGEGGGEAIWSLIMICYGVMATDRRREVTGQQK